jgi:helix-turn-helix protein
VCSSKQLKTIAGYFQTTIEKQTREATEETSAEEQVMIPFFILLTSMTRPKCTKHCAAKFNRPTSEMIAVDERSVYNAHSQ